MYTFGRSLEHTVISCWAVIVVDSICDFLVISHVIFKLLLWIFVLQFHWYVVFVGFVLLWCMLSVASLWGIRQGEYVVLIRCHHENGQTSSQSSNLYCHWPRGSWVWACIQTEGNPCHHQGGSLEGQGYSSFIQTGGCRCYCWPRTNVWLEPPVSKQACKQASKTFGECTLSCSQQFWWDMMRLDHCCYCHLNFLE